MTDRPSIRRRAKHLLRRLAPSVAEMLEPWHHDRHMRAHLRRVGLDRVQAAFVAAHGDRVSAGPFAGMRYVAEASGSVLVPKLIGSYERELHETIASRLARPYARVVDVGCAEGYYAVGFARFAAGRPRVIGFDLNPRARRLCRRLAGENGVADRVEVRGRCEPDELARAAVPGTLVVMDCEGYEYELLDRAVTALASCDLVVELHGEPDGAAARVAEGLGGTHTVEVVRSEPRDTTLYPALATFGPGEQSLMLDEMRPGPQAWLIADARSSPLRGGV